jgi:hypothetical protein
MLLGFVLCISSVACFGAAPQSASKDPRTPDPNPALAHHLDIPKNCQQTFEANGSVLLTCECENCGQAEARDGFEPVPWSCVMRKDGVSCGYAIDDPVETGSRAKSKI